ncbi:WEB family protein At3g51220 [Malus domestica]|uniref:WEB family protein At3g51220 n=1 Tax=Malus domestica TaxID=3750 RepID=UPI0039768805
MTLIHAHHFLPSSTHISMESETQHSLQLPEENPAGGAAALTLPHVNDYNANVDTARPFRSVKEAVAIFDERLLLGDMFSSPKPLYTNNIVQSSPTTTPSWKFSPPNYKESEEVRVSSYGDREEKVAVMDTLKKLEAELEETKVELKLLKERESETEVALASLNAELHKNMSKLARAEADAAAKASNVLHVSTTTTSSSPNITTMGDNVEERNKGEWMIRMENSTSLAQVLTIGTTEKQGGAGYHHVGAGYYDYVGRNREKKTMKKKPIVPLVQDLLSWKKGSKYSSSLCNPFYSSTQLYY